MHPNASECIRTHPNASGCIRTGPNASEQVQASPKTSEILRVGGNNSKHLRKTSIFFQKISRMACLEMRDFDDVPATVTINEAVELAKKFGSKESKAFVNGIADRLGRNLGRIQ